MELTNETRNKYGIVYTPNPLVTKILDLIPQHYYQNPNLKWLDSGAGNGAFVLNLYNRLVNDLSGSIPNSETRKTHIIENMITMCEIYPPHIEKLRTLFSHTHKANIIAQDFLTLQSQQSLQSLQFDIIIGNPPYNINGKIKTPTNNNITKNNDGKQSYVDFVNQSLMLLKPNGLLALIIPTLWMKPDKAGLYNTLTTGNFTIKKLVCLSTSQTQKEFNYQAQTPTCYFYGVLNNIQKQEKQEKQEKIHTIKVYDSCYKNYVDYLIRPHYPIPTHGTSIINKLLYYVDLVGHLKVYKTNTPPRGSLFSNEATQTNTFHNILTTKLCKKTPLLVKNYSNCAQAFSNIPKLIMAHKMHGFPYLDSSGHYGLSSRDNYIISIKDYSLNELQQIQAFLSSKTALFIFSTTNYRMRYLERYAFQFIPAITKLINFPNLLGLTLVEREKLISNFFNFSHIENTNIAAFTNYYHFIDN
jgi:tRNA1(Val) A37 N6-methylase TrmN6